MMLNSFYSGLEHVASNMTVEEQGSGDRAQPLRTSNSLRDGILQMIWDSFEIIKVQKDDYDGLCVQSCNKWWEKLFFKWRNASDEVAQATLKQLDVFVFSSFLVLFYSLPVWTFLWPPAHLMDKLHFHSLLLFNKPNVLTLLLLSVFKVSKLKRITYKNSLDSLCDVTTLEHKTSTSTSCWCL